MTTTVDPRYELGELVASGGMADVYRGHDRLLGRRVAIKRLRGVGGVGGAGDDRAARERFERESRMLAGFAHPNAVAVYDAVEDDAGPLIVMEFVEGRTLRAVLRAAGRLPVDQAVAIADQLLAALGAAHARGIVHRDIKPGNVLVTDDGHVKLADFGIATMADAADLTQAGEVMGTPKYLSPEQAVGKRATSQSDLYAVGLLCFEMVCGRAPFEGDTPAATMAAHQQAPVPSLRDRCPTAPEWYVAVVERALAKDPAQRYPNAEAMRHALRAGLRNDVTVADSTLALPVVVGADPVATGRPAAPLWPVLLFVLLGALVAIGVWALGASGPSTLTEVPTTDATTFPSTFGQPETTTPPNPPSTVAVPGPGPLGDGAARATESPTAAPPAPPAAVEKPGRVPPGQAKKNG